MHYNTYNVRLGKIAVSVAAISAYDAEVWARMRLGLPCVGTGLCISKDDWASDMPAQQHLPVAPHITTAA